MDKKKNGKGNEKSVKEEDIKELVNSIKIVIENLIMLVTQNNEKVNTLNNNVDKIHSSTLQAVSSFEVAREYMQDSVKEIKAEIRHIDDNVRKLDK